MNDFQRRIIAEVAEAWLDGSVALWSNWHEVEVERLVKEHHIGHGDYVGTILLTYHGKSYRCEYERCQPMHDGADDIYIVRTVSEVGGESSNRGELAEW